MLTEPDDVQTMFDNIPVPDKKLQWIGGTTRRWDGSLPVSGDDKEKMAHRNADSLFGLDVP